VSLSEKLRIAIFSDSALPILNGVSISIQSLVSELRNQGHSVTIFTAAHPGHKDSDPNIYRFPAIETPWTRNYPLAYPPFYGMLRKFRRHTFDVIHTHTPFTIGFVGLRWAESHEIPIVSTYHTLYDRYAHYIPFFPRRYIRFKIAKHTNFYYNHVDHVITPTAASHKWLRRHSVTRPISVIPTGTPPRGFIDRAEMRHRLGIPAGQRIMLYVGRIAREKNLPTLFSMAAEVMKTHPEVRLWLVGDGPYRAEATAMARELGIGDRVNFVGFVPREQVDRYYAAADLFVFSSITETQGLVVQEAMTYGLPAIAVIGGGASAAIQQGENGFVAKNDVADFTQAVLRVLEDDDLYARLSEGAARTVRSYTTADMARAVLDVYGGVLEHKRRELEEERYYART
jgi:1,2-diacylglycerol 3-alpha-glucosyltransferase